MKKNLLADILGRLKNAQWLSAERNLVETETLVEECLLGDPPPMKDAQFLGTIDFVRAVHAEMAAISEAARHGTATNGATLYTTTFPCHDCAKHIVAAGIERVVYIEPYPKSLVPELHGNAVSVDSPDGCGGRVRFEPFVGIAPNRYTEFFRMKGRKGRDGHAAEWSASTARPYLPQHQPDVVLAAETAEISGFAQLVKDKGLELVDASGEGGT